MKIKVCGLNNQENVSYLLNYKLDFIGLIFYEKSKRSVMHGNIDNDFVKSVLSAKKVGVFVDESLNIILKWAQEYELDYIQLHGTETPALCMKVRENGLKVIKAVSVSNKLPTELLKGYQNTVDLFLFDASGKKRGGNGTKFDWKILLEYGLKTPFLLAGGISLEDVNEIKKLNVRELYGVDLNSKFELEPGIKDVNQVKQFIEDIK